MSIEKNDKIRESRIATQSKHKSMRCKTFRFKIDQSSLSHTQKEALKMYFIETKRLYNYILSKHKDDIFTINYKDCKSITYLDKNKNEIDYNLSYIGSSIMQDTIRIMRDSIKGLLASKKNGNKVGCLNFKSECNSIRLFQYGITHKIIGSRIKVQGIKKPIRVNGLKQLNKHDNIDYTTANLLYDGYDYFISLTCFVEPNKEIINKKDIIGIDLGCESTITTSEGKKVKVSVGESERLKGLQARLAKRTKCSNNWYKDRKLIQKEYNKMCNKKNDLSNKIVHSLTSRYNIIVMQDDQLNEWHKSENISKTVQHSILGRIKTKLKMYEGVVVLDQWFPTSKHCFNCGHDNDLLTLKDRTFTCPVCGAQSDRDIHAALNMIEYFNEYQSLGTRDLKPRKKGLLMKSHKISRLRYDSYKTLFKTGSQESL